MTKITSTKKSGKNPLMHQAPGVTFEEVSQMITEAKAAVSEQAKSELDRHAQAVQSSLFVVFGIFASMIAFLTIEFQFLKTLNNIYQILGFMFVLCALLLGFNLVLDYLMKNLFDKAAPKPSVWLILMIGSLLGLGIVFIICGSGSLQS